MVRTRQPWACNWVLRAKNFDSGRSNTSIWRDVECRQVAL
jgi:hypothetical protein